jgi:homogentisate 1,2-dioxygenase
MVARAFIDEIRTLAAAGISAAYADVGSPAEYPIRLVCFSNNTMGDMMFTDDVTKDKIFVKSGSFKLIDVQSNINPQFDDKYVLPIGTQFSVKQLTAPTSGDVYIEVFY